MNHHRYFTLIELVIVIVLLAVLAGMLLPALNQTHCGARRIDCAGNLKQVGLALIMYAGDDVEGGFFPDGTGTDLSDLHTQKYLIDGKVYGCPKSITPSVIAAVSDFTYLGSGLKDTNKRPTISSLAYDESGNHPDNEWCNVLYVDGHVNGGEPE